MPAVGARTEKIKEKNEKDERLKTRESKDMHGSERKGSNDKRKKKAGLYDFLYEINTP